MNSIRRVSAACVALLFLLMWQTGTASAAPPVMTALVNQAQQRCMLALGGEDLSPRLCDAYSAKWKFEPVPGGTSDKKMISDEWFDFCLDTNGDRLYIHACNGGIHQQWYVTPFQAQTPPAGQVGVRLKNVATGICIDNPNKNFNGSKIAVNRTCNDGPYQQWNVSQAAYDQLTGTAPAEGHWGMTWRTLEQRADNVVHVGSDGRTNPYAGDTRPSELLPLLCAFRDGRAPAPGVPLGSYHSWFHGEVKVTVPIAGSTLTSLARANQICAENFGAGWRMASFHDGGGWSFWANGTLPGGGARFWAYIEDSPANPWN